MSDGWRVVWVAFTVAVFGWGVGFYGPAVYLPALHATRGWSISMISIAVTAHYLLSAALIAWLPEAYRRFGVHRITCGGALLAGLGAVSWANVQAPWQLVPALLLSGAGWAATSGAALNPLSRHGSIASGRRRSAWRSMGPASAGLSSRHYGRC